mmetsp:Transcript_25755/g.81774  ORF Transcript_25755/g.81774 Transcript_25755/m.81774 type:complete len:874 (+) Transcript_25755:134-2755(+)
MARTRMRRKRDAHTCTPTYHHHGPNRWEEGQREEEGRPGGSLDGCPGRLLCGLCSVLHDEFRHGLDRWVIEDQCHGQIDSWQLLGERIAQEHRSVAGEAALHERVVVLDVLVVADEALGQLHDLALEDGGVQARADVQLHELGLVAAARRGARGRLLRGGLLLRHGHLARLHGPLLHLELLTHLLLLHMLLVDLGLAPLHPLKLCPGHVLTLRISDLLAEVDRLLAKLPSLPDVPGEERYVGHEGQCRRLALRDAGSREDLQRLLCRLVGVGHLPVHHRRLARGEERGPQRHRGFQLPRDAQGILCHLGSLVGGGLVHLLVALALLLLLGDLHDERAAGVDHHVHLLLSVARLLHKRQERAQHAQGGVKLLLRDVDLHEGLQGRGLARLVLDLRGLVLRLPGRGRRLLEVALGELRRGELQQRRDLALHVLGVRVKLAGLRCQSQRPALLLLLEVHIRTRLERDSLLLGVLQVLEDGEGLLRRPQSVVMLVVGAVQRAHRAEELPLALPVTHLLQGVRCPLRIPHGPARVVHPDVAEHHHLLARSLPLAVPGLREPVELIFGELHGLLELLLRQVRLDQGLDDRGLPVGRLQVVLEDVHRLPGCGHGIIDVAVLEMPDGGLVQLKGRLLLQLCLHVQGLRLLRRPQRTLGRATEGARAPHQVHRVGLGRRLPQLAENGDCLLDGLLGLIGPLLHVPPLLQEDGRRGQLGRRHHELVALPAEEPQSLLHLLERLLDPVGSSHGAVRLREGQSHLRLRSLVGRVTEPPEFVLRHCDALVRLARAAEHMDSQAQRVGKSSLVIRIPAGSHRIACRLLSLNHRLLHNKSGCKADELRTAGAGAGVFPDKAVGEGAQPAAFHHNVRLAREERRHLSDT